MAKPITTNKESGMKQRQMCRYLPGEFGVFWTWSGFMRQQIYSRGKREAFRIGNSANPTRARWRTQFISELRQCIDLDEAVRSAAASFNGSRSCKTWASGSRAESPPCHSPG